MIVKLVNRAFSESGMSKTQFAKELGIAKSFILRVLNGEKPLSQNMLDGILSIKNISIETKTALKEEYEKLSFGAKNYEDVQYLIKLINGFDESINRRDSVYVREEILEKVLFGNQFNFCVNSESELYEIVSFFVKRGLYKSESRFYSNFSFSQKMLSSLLFTLFYERDFNVGFDFCHIVNIKNDDIHTILNNVFEALKWSELCFNTLGASAENHPIGAIFPYYIITDEVVIIFNEDCSKATIFNDKSTVDFYADYFSRIKLQYSPLLDFHIDEFECLNSNVLSKYNLQTSIDGALCVMQFTDVEILDKVVPNQIPQREFLIHSALNYFQSTFNKNPVQYLSKDSLSKFAEDGDLRLISPKNFYPVPIDFRKKLFENMKPGLNNIYVMNSEKISPYKEMDIHIFDKKLSIMLYPTNKKSPYYSIYYEILFEKNRALEIVFKNMAKLLNNSDYVYGKEFLNETVEKMILKCSFSDDSI
ncbi:MAG: helix-turn-helix transcriptional regulator [Clostridia bacterium]|nr:helix-turn-helix transcriptional regulator [Clostridia bacterium]